MGVDLSMWLKSESQIQTVAQSIGTTWVNFFGRDPMRFAVFLPFSTGSYYNISFSPATPTYYYTAQSSNSPWVYISRDDVGDILCEPIWVKSGASNQFTQVTTMSYNPRRWEQYERLVQQYLSQYSS